MPRQEIYWSARTSGRAASRGKGREKGGALRGGAGHTKTRTPTHRTPDSSLPRGHVSSVYSYEDMRTRSTEGLHLIIIYGRWEAQGREEAVQFGLADLVPFFWLRPLLLASRKSHFAGLYSIVIFCCTAPITWCVPTVFARCSAQSCALSPPTPTPPRLSSPRPRPLTLPTLRRLGVASDNVFPGNHPFLFQRG